MRLIITVAILVLQFNLFAQEIAKCIEVLGTDSLKFYFKSHGVLVDKECADYYRIAKVSHDWYFFNGQSKDYYLSGQMVVDSHYINNSLHGKYTSFYSNGQIKESGQFNEGQKVGEWKSWHENGQLKKIFIFGEQDYFLKEFYKSNGKQIIADGNGEYVDIDLRPKTTIKGEIKNGKQHGKWTIKNQVSGLMTGIELFENGKFIEGQNIAQVKSFNGKYFDYPKSLIDLTVDLFTSYSRKIDCIRPGLRKPKRYKSQYSLLSFSDYIYQNFDPPKFDRGYILAGFTINKSGKITNISLHTTLPDKSVADQLIAILNASEEWEPETLNGDAIESTGFFALQFLNGAYKIMGDWKSYASVEYGAQINKGRDYLINFVESKINLSDKFQSKGFDLAASVRFHIDEAGHCITDNSVFENRAGVTDDERTLNDALIEILKKTDGQWRPATYDNAPVKHYFYGIFTIKDGKTKFRLLSMSWMLKAGLR